MLVSVIAFACVDNNGSTVTDGLSEEYYSGGKLGTVFNEGFTAYEQPTPATENAGLLTEFKYGEAFFEKKYLSEKTGVRHGLGPLYIRSSCVACHPSYGHGKRMERYNADDHGNGYLLVITDETDTYLSSLTGMPQTRAVAPFKAPIDESKIEIKWENYTDKWGNKFPDGEAYSLIYPEVNIPADAYYVPLEVGTGENKKEVPYANVKVRLEATIGIYGTGLLDAIPDDSLKAQYAKAESHGAKLNPAIFANGDWTGMYAGADGNKYAKRFTYALSRGPLQDGPGSNAIWNITNVTRSDRKKHYMTETYAKTASEDSDVQATFYDYFPEHNKTGIVKDDIYNFLMGSDLTAEMTDKEYKDFMIWHRGLAVPAARNLDDEVVQKGKKAFYSIGCTNCHRPSWTTGADDYADPNGFFKEANELPRYPHQKIWPYTDMVQHKLYMKNDIRTGWCRTTPLWGRGLSQKCTGASDHLHDMRARNYVEAIMWHAGDKDNANVSDAYKAVEKFRNLTKADRDALVKFLESI